ncbi:hypothetical protein ATANTOWER_018275 [Ataeniobius toweri]|uniref:Uncharacterized protein n=1 Tax=Ataeniobius toweri TaxID=208326 RepID=A0ABU7BHB7_9TELE|nr:hypothetical protein [Ataeniobius toweri]
MFVSLPKCSSISVKIMLELTLFQPSLLGWASLCSIPATLLHVSDVSLLQIEINELSLVQFTTFSRSLLLTMNSNQVLGSRETFNKMTRTESTTFLPYKKYSTCCLIDLSSD